MGQSFSSSEQFPIRQKSLGVDASVEVTESLGKKSSSSDKTEVSPTHKNRNDMNNQEQDPSSGGDNSSSRGSGLTGGHVSRYTVETEYVPNDEGTAPVQVTFHRLNIPKRKKRKRGCCRWKLCRFFRRCCCCCRRRRKGRQLTPQDREDRNMLRSASMHATTGPGSKKKDSDLSLTDSELEGLEMENGEFSLKVRIRTKGQERRIRIPNHPDMSMSLWTIIKNAIGKDLTKLPLPVNFNEPISMLQRLTEDYEYSSLLQAAAAARNSQEEMAYVAAFTVSSYSSCASRTGKPFNPILGETYECDRMEDLKWRCFSEQVSHHPPMVAQYCEGAQWSCSQQFTMISKFKGNSIEIVPMGITHLVFKNGSHYTWRKVSSVVHNVMIGRLWIDQEGEMDITNYTTGDTCHIIYKPTSTFRGDIKRVDGTIYDNFRRPKLTIGGHWDSKMEVFDIVNSDSQGRFTLGPPRTLWTRIQPASDCDKYYYFTPFACQLNEMEMGIAPTDSRNRPDQRLMENGYLDEANLEKLRLEEKQRTMKKLRLAQTPSKKTVVATKLTTFSETASKTNDLATNVVAEVGYTPAWFGLEKNSVTDKVEYTFTHEYWKCKTSHDWSRCPDIF